MRVRNNLLVLFFILLNSVFAYSQSDIEKILKGGEIIVNGLTFFKKNKAEIKVVDTKIIESVCVKNNLSDKIAFNLVGKDEEGNTVKKELVIQKEGKECVFELPKGIYTYEIVLSNKEIFKKGEYKFNDDMIITVK